MLKTLEKGGALANKFTDDKLHGVLGMSFDTCHRRHRTWWAQLLVDLAAVNRTAAQSHPPLPLRSSSTPSA
jgi:hypothetical protein